MSKLSLIPYIAAFVALAPPVFMLTSCNSGDSPTSTVVSGTVGTTGGPVTGQVALSIYSSTGTLIYSGTNASTSLSLTSGVAYNFQLNGTNVAAGTTFTLQETNIDVINGTPTNVTLNLGDNPVTIATSGDFLFAIGANGAAASTTSSQTYQASVTCANPTFTVSSLTPSGISVTAGSGTNLYNFSASSVVTGANGTAPYLCAWDLDGDAIQDTAFSPCGTAVSNDYVNDLGTRNIGLLVKDACNTTVAVAASQTLAYTVPVMPGSVFIYGQTSASTGTATTDLRLNAVNYLATNSGGYNIVLPLYTPGANGTGSYVISATLNYGLPSSVKFGEQIELTGFSDTINVSTMTGTVDASAAKIKQVSFSTDEVGDQTPARSLLGTACTLTNPNATVIFQAGTPCSAGTTGDNNSADVEVWGNYVCPVSDASGGVTITGEFDGIAHLADSCTGGGGGGGGTTPIGL
jgi:hypothetical protein